MANISLTGLNYFKIEGNPEAYELTLKDLNGNLFKQVVIEADADSVPFIVDIQLPELYTLNFPTDTKLIVILSGDNSNGIQIGATGNDFINGSQNVVFTPQAFKGSSVTLTPVDGNNWSAVFTETIPAP